MPRDYKSSPVADGIGLREIVLGLAGDLQDMRDKKISPQEGLARAAVAKQLFNGVRLYLQAFQFLESQRQRDAGALPAADQQEPPP